MKIRKAVLKDAGRLNEANKQYFGEYRDYHEEIADVDTVVLVAEEANKIIGISGFKINEWNNAAWLLNIFVHPDYRRRNIGTNLIKQVIERVGEKGLRCLVAEAPSKSDAPKLFEHNGFRKCGYNDRYYTNSPGEVAEFWSYDIVVSKEKIDE